MASVPLKVATVGWVTPELAPVTGPFYGPPLTGNFPVNPYFPGPAGAMGWGPIPGGPPPGPVMPVPPVWVQAESAPHA